MKRRILASDEVKNKFLAKIDKFLEKYSQCFNSAPEINMISDQKAEITIDPKPEYKNIVAFKNVWYVSDDNKYENFFHVNIKDKVYWNFRLGESLDKSIKKIDIRLGKIEPKKIHRNTKEELIEHSEHIYHDNYDGKNWVELGRFKSCLGYDMIALKDIKWGDSKVLALDTFLSRSDEVTNEWKQNI